VGNGKCWIEFIKPIEFDFFFSNIFKNTSVQKMAVMHLVCKLPITTKEDEAFSIPAEGDIDNCLRIVSHSLAAAAAVVVAVLKTKNPCSTSY